jgi:hypothetical protein
MLLDITYAGLRTSSAREIGSQQHLRERKRHRQRGSTVPSLPRTV